MAILQVIGATGAIQQTDSRGWTYPTGESEQLVYKGVYAAVKSLYDQYVAIAEYTPTVDSLNIVYQRGLGTLTVSTVQDGPIQYERITNHFQAPIFENPYFTTVDTPLTAQETHAVRVAFETGIQTNPTNSLNPAYPFDGSAFSDKAAVLYAFLAQGVESYQRSAYVLRASMVASKRSLFVIDNTGDNTVVTPPNTASVNSLIGSLPDGEWLKQCGDVQMFGNRKWKLTWEYWWAPQWSSILYSGTGTP